MLGRTGFGGIAHAVRGEARRAACPHGLGLGEGTGAKSRLTLRGALLALLMLVAAPALAAPTVWVAPSLVRVRPTDTAGTATAITIYAAKGETESFQIIVQAPSTGALTNVNVTAPTLGTATSTFYREHYLYLARGSADWTTNRNKPQGAGYWPDGLVPFVNPDTGAALNTGAIVGAPFSVTASQNQPVWVDVAVPRTATAGTYTGTYTVTSDQGQASVSVTLKVWSFRLPLAPALRSSFLYSDSGAGHGVLQPDRELLRNRLNPISTTLSYERRLIDESGMGSTNISFWSDSFTVAAPSVASITAEKARHQSDLYKYCYSGDEVSSPSLYPAIKAWGLALHQAGVDQLVTMAPVPELYDDGSGTGRSAVDDWVLLPKMYDAYESNVLAVQAKGDKVWSYNCTQQDDYSPKWLLDYAPINFRIQPGFISESLGLVGLLYWRVDWWSADTWNGSQQWASYPGEGVLVYPGDDIGLTGQVAPSMRLKYLRDGVDDYDYVELLKAAGYGDWALSVARTVGPDWSNWTRDPEALEAARIQLGNCLDGLAAGEDTVTVTVSAAPTSIASAGATTLTASAVSSSGSTISAWSWSDGSAGGTFSPSATTQSPTYTAAANTTGSSRTITLTATATDGSVSGGQSVSITEATVVTSHAVTVSASASPTTIASGGTTTLTATASDNQSHTGFAYAWSDGGVGGTFSPSATVASPTYTPPANTTGVAVSRVLTITATCKWTAPWVAASKTVTVTENSAPVAPLVVTPEAGFTATGTSGTTPRTVQFTDGSTNTPTTWAWSFGDGGTSTSQHPSHTYTTAGSYTVALTASNTAGSDTETKTGFVTVTIPAPVANFTGTGTSGTMPRAVQFTDASTGSPTSWAWSFGDGGTSTQQHPSHTYTAAGAYTVALTATNAGGSNTVTKTGFVTVTVPAPVADFSATGTNGDAPLLTQFTDGSTNTPTSWAWDFGDGGASTRQHPNHTYTTAGTYTVTLIATNAGGSSTMVKSDFVIATVPEPEASFSATTTSGRAPLVVQFTDTSSNSPTSWLWAFGDGETSALQHPSHTYTAAGTYAVTLTASNAGGSDDATQTGLVTVTPPLLLAGFTGAERNGAAPRAVQFADTSTGGPTAWSWDFGDGATSTEQHPQHTYTAGGSYTVSLTVTNADQTATETESDYVTVTADIPTASFTATPTSGTAPVAVAFADASTGSPSEWQWDFGDGTTSTEQSPSHTYTAAGTYIVTLYASNANGGTSATVTITVGAAPLLADFSASTRRGAGPLSVGFSDLSSPTPVAWAWDFGDGTQSSEQSPTHDYSLGGAYTVALNVTWENGQSEVQKVRHILVDFSDVAEDFWAHYQVMACLSAGVAAGYDDGTYQPATSVTRDQMAAFLARAVSGGEESVPTGPATPTFADVPADFWAYRYIEYAADRGIVQGYEGNEFRPSGGVDRAQMAVFIARAVVAPTEAAGLSEYAATSAPEYTDVATDYWAYSYISYLSATGVVSGYSDGTYRPEEAVTRDQMAVFIARAFGLSLDF